MYDEHPSGQSGRARLIDRRVVALYFLKIASPGVTAKSIGLITGIAGAILGLAIGLPPVLNSFSQGKARAPFVPTLDSRGPYLIAATKAASEQYREAMAEARKLHPGCGEIVFEPGNLESVRASFNKLQPRYALVFILPTELDVNFAWKWLQLTTDLDDDPFVDVRTGFITGRNSTDAKAFMSRIRSVIENKTPLAGMCIDNLGPNTMARNDAFYQTPGNFMIPVLAGRVGQRTISHGTNGFSAQRLGSLDGAGIVHFGGHGYPDRVVDGASSAQVGQLKLAPCVAFNGACYTGVTGRWFEMRDKLVEQEVGPEASFCLAALANNVLGYLAALHPDHGVPVYQEMEFLATDGASLGDIIKHTHDGVILANGGKLPQLEPFTNGMASPSWTPVDYMLKGTASRVLFGDPALVLTPAFTAPAFYVTCRSDGADTLYVTAVLQNAKLKSTFTDTYYSDLSSVPNLFNDRALITCTLPDAWNSVRRVEVLRVAAKGRTMKSRLQGFGIEEDSGLRLLHVQVDLPTTGYMESEFRSAGAQIELRLSR